MNDNQHLTATAYSHFNLPESILRGLDEAGFEYCTPIQAETLPITLKGIDIAGEAQTGTGKTAAFLVALFNRLVTQAAPAERKKNQIRAIIIAPTRELAIQIHKDAKLLGQYTDLTMGLAYGGTDYQKQRDQLEAGVDILIGTPGRIIDFFKQGVFKLNAVESVVLDEADRMFDLGFIDDIRYLLNACPEPSKRLSMLFSATLSLRISELAYVHMNEPESIKIESETKTADNIDQVVYYPANDEKIPLLLGLMQRDKPSRSIVFINTKRMAEKIYAFLKGNEISASVLSGDVPQKKREALLKSFQNGEASVLVATDVAARGLHIPEVSHVFNFDLPQSSEDYVHRIGRTGRAGASGHAISFACEDYAHYLPEIEDYIGHSIASQSVTAELLIKPKPAAKIDRPAKTITPYKREQTSAKREQTSAKPAAAKKPNNVRSHNDISQAEKAPLAATKPTQPFPAANQENIFIRMLRFMFS
ncbi:MAG: ATP-dependent RNA helicase RhlB [Gammaproteobacteria bacterium]|nr:ATP-dependent RNA helicase RhlB [Gammaproteobacteria bacterium]